MGSYDYTCAVSGLPIRAGDQVRFLLLTQNPYEENAGSRACYAHDWWFPRTFPLLGVYNDYGSIEPESAETGLAQDIWLEGFKLDIVNRGWGDNSCHDVPTSHNMTFRALLGAVQEGRVLVRQIERERILSPSELAGNGRPKVPRGVPTVKRVQSRLVRAGLNLFGGFTAEGFLVDNRQYGTVRVRFQGGEWGKEADQLRVAEQALSDYATVIRAGTGSYAGSADLFVHVKPCTEGFHGGSRREKLRPLLISQAMIREDVWQTLLDFRIPGMYGTTDQYREFVIASYAKHAAFLAEDTNNTLHYWWFENGGDQANPVAWTLFKNDVPGTIGLATHWELMAKKNAVGNVDQFLSTVAETAYVRGVLQRLRFIWVPSSSRGVQYGEFDIHAKYLRYMSQLASLLHKEG